MYIPIRTKKTRKPSRTRSNRYRAKLARKQVKRVRRMVK